MMDKRQIYAIVDKMVEEGIFSTDPGKINKEYIDNLNVLNCGNLISESIVDTIKIKKGNENTIYQIVVTGNDICSLCFSVKRCSTFYPMTSDERINNNVVCRIYLPTMQMIKYVDDIDNDFAQVLYQVLNVVGKDRLSNFKFIVCHITKELRNKSKIDLFDPDVLEKYIIDVYNMIENNLGLVKYWRSSETVCEQSCYFNTEKQFVSAVQEDAEEYVEKEEYHERGNGLLYDMSDMYYYIKSEDLRNYLHEKEIFLGAWDQAYLLYNSGLDERTIVNGLKEIAKNTSDSNLINLINSRVGFMENARAKFRLRSVDEFYIGTIDGEDSPILRAFADIDICHRFMLGKSNGRRFKIHKLSIISGNDMGDSISGNAAYNEIGEALYYHNNRIAYLYTNGPTDKKFEVCFDSVLPHPFRTGDVVTDGEYTYVVTEPCCEDCMNKVFESYKKGEISDNSVKFLIPCVKTTEDGTVEHCMKDIRNIAFVDKDHLSDILSKVIARSIRYFNAFKKED